MRRISLGLLVVLALACGDDDGDAAIDLGSSSDLGSPADLGSSPDFGDDTPDLGSPADLGTAPDMNATPDMSAEADMFTEADLGTSSDPVPVQCREDADCGTGTCNLSAPGGICNGCVDGSCPSGTTCSDFGTCIRDCDDDGDCAPGFECLGSGRCALATPCDATVCPAPYVCGAIGCERPTCAGGCPSAFSCRGGYCVENE